MKFFRCLETSSLREAGHTFESDDFKGKYVVEEDGQGTTRLHFRDNVEEISEEEFLQ